MDYEKIFERLFKNKGIKKQLDQTPYSYLGAMFYNKNLTYEELVIFINTYKKDLIESALNDNLLIDNILYENGIIDVTKKDLITEEYLEGLIVKINNKEFDPKVITFYLYLMTIHNLFGNKYDENTLKEILNLNLMSILNNPNLLTADGNILLGNDEKIQLAEKFLSWNKKCGETLLPYIFQFETLKEYITVLINSNQVRNNIVYQKTLLNLLKICEYSIKVRDTNIIPSKEEVKQINNLFQTYNFINKSIIIDTLNDESIMLVHFVRDNDVNYQLVGNDIIDMSDKNNNAFDLEQSNFFINSYYKYAISIIEQQTGKSFDIDNPQMRNMLRENLAYFNNIINYKPLDRLPISKREIDSSFHEYIRKTDGRISCSFVPNINGKAKTHLDRKIGLIIQPTMDAIISTSHGYTSEKNFYDLKKDSVPCTRIFSELGKKEYVNETCVDVTKCEVIGVLLLSDEKDIVERAEKIACSYNTKIIRIGAETDKKEKH